MDGHPYGSVHYSQTTCGASSSSERRAQAKIHLSCGGNAPIEVSAQPRIYFSDVRLLAHGVGGGEVKGALPTPHPKRHNHVMGRERGEQPSPDLFSTDAVRDASPLPPRPPATEATAEPAPQRHVLPKNLRKAVKHLNDEELDLLHTATLDEMKRRGRLPPSVKADPRPRRAARALGFVRIEKETALRRSDAELRGPAFSWPCKAGRESFARGPHDAPLDRNADSPGRAPLRRECVKAR